MQRLSFEELVALEKKFSLWEYTLFDYPLWMHCREPLLSSMMAERKLIRPKTMDILKSFFKTIKFLLTQKKYDKVFFLMERSELLEIYKVEKSTRKLLFLNHEQDRVYTESDYISSDFFNLLRYLSRKVAFLIFFKRYREVIKTLEDSGYGTVLHDYIKNAFGDALFLQFLSIVLSKKNEKFYSGSVIPMGEKFLNRLNTFEVQHGIIHPHHVGYIGLPEVKNSLILYSDRYVRLMKDHGYRGELIVNEYKKTFFQKLSNRYFPIVIYTQPTPEMQKNINEFMKRRLPENIFIQKHPKDYFEYEVDSRHFVSETTPIEVGCPIMYISSVIENFTLYDKTCYIYDLKLEEVDLEEFIAIYTQGSSSEMVVIDELDKIYEIIVEEGLCLK